MQIAHFIYNTDFKEEEQQGALKNIIYWLYGMNNAFFMIQQQTAIYW